MSDTSIVNGAAVDLNDAILCSAPASAQNGSLGLPAPAFSSVAFAALEARTVWQRSWVYVGVSADIPHRADVLPFTVGMHGIHIERMADGRVEGRFNRAQHGGCGVIPLQCQSGTKMRCPQAACGYSRDRKPIRHVKYDSDALRELLPFTGSRPQMLPLVAVQECGGLIMVNLYDPRDIPPAPRDKPAVLPGWHRLQEAWMEVSANWKLAACYLAAGTLSEPAADGMSIYSRMEGSGGLVRVILRYPNVVLWQTDLETCVVVLQPLAPGMTLCRTSVFGRNMGNRPAPIFDWNELLRNRYDIAETTQQALASSAASDLPATAGQRVSVARDEVENFVHRRVHASVTAPDDRGEVPLLTRAYRINPRFGFAG